MYQGVYKIAGHNIQIVSLYDKVQELCKDYVSSETPEYRVEVKQEDIVRETEKSEADDRKAGREIRRYSEDYLETLAVYRKIAELLIEKDIVLFHGSVVAVDGEGYLFTAKSGVGKSTHVRLWTEEFKERAVVINDDKPLLEIKEDGILVYGTPWNGKHNRGINSCVPLKAICVVNRGEQNFIETMDNKQGYPFLLQQIYRPSDNTKMEKTLQLISKIAKDTELYKLHCNMEQEAARIAYMGMNQK